MTRLFPCLVLLLCCLAACTSRNVPDKAGYTPVAAPWTCATYLDSGENALTPVLMLDGWAAARTQQVRLGTAGTDALLDHLEAWCPTHREEKLADVILAWRRRHADRGRMLPAVSCAGWYAPATRPITGNEQQLALSLWLAGHALGGPVWRSLCRTSSASTVSSPCSTAARAPCTSTAAAIPMPSCSTGSRPWAWKRRRAPLVRQRRTRPKTTSNILI